MTMTSEQITALVTPLAAIVIAYLQFLQRRQSNANAVKLDEVKALGQQTHTLVNSNMGTQLLVASTLAQRVADLTEQPEDAQVARETRKKYDEHMASQKKVDAGAPGGAANAAPPTVPPVKTP